MNKAQCLKQMYKHNSMIKRSCDRLLLYQPGMNACDWAKKAKIGLSNVYILARKYKIKLGSHRSQNAREERLERLKNDFVSRWNKDLTVGENARRLDITWYKAATICREFNLSSGYKNKIRLTTLRHIEKIEKYRKKGLSDAEIARVIGMTRERIRQLSYEKGKK